MPGSPAPAPADGTALNDTAAAPTRGPWWTLWWVRVLAVATISRDRASMEAELAMEREIAAG